MRHPVLILAVLAAFLCAHTFAADPKAVKIPPKPGAATPPPKKKRGELEGEEEPVQQSVYNPNQSKVESYSVTMPLVGKWETAGKSIIIANTGAYTLAGAETDAGFVQASLGLVWRKSNRDQRWVEGRYKFRSMDAVEIEAAFGSGEWRRVK